MPNVFDPEWESRGDAPAPFTPRGARVGARAGARELGASVYEFGPGEAMFPFHVHHSNEEMVVVLAGRPTLRTYDGERELEPGDVVAFPTGRSGAHRLDNRGDAPARVLMISTMRYPEVVEYPDSEKWGARTGDPRDPESKRILFRRDPSIGYFDGET